MPTRTRALTHDDISSIIAMTAENADHRAIYKHVERIAAETVGWVLLTTLCYDEKKGVVTRLHSSDEKSYPVGGTKPLDQLTENQRIMDRGDVAFAPTRADVKRIFFDHELIFSLGITAILNAPIRQGGRRLGTLNFCGTEGMYDPSAVKTAKILAGLLIPTVAKDMPRA
jgi:GAF domain-containing protein